MTWGSNGGWQRGAGGGRGGNGWWSKQKCTFGPCMKSEKAKQCGGHVWTDCGAEACHECLTPFAAAPANRQAEQTRLREKAKAAQEQRAKAQDEEAKRLANAQVPGNAQPAQPTWRERRAEARLARREKKTGATPKAAPAASPAPAAVPTNNAFEALAAYDAEEEEDEMEPVSPELKAQMDGALKELGLLPAAPLAPPGGF